MFACIDSHVIEIQYGLTYLLLLSQIFQFGRSLDLSQDGSMLVVGAWNNDDAAENSGHAQVFRFDGSTWNQVGSTLTGDAASDRFVSNARRRIVALYCCHSQKRIASLLTIYRNPTTTGLVRIHVQRWKYNCR